MEKKKLKEITNKRVLQCDEAKMIGLKQERRNGKTAKQEKRNQNKKKKNRTTK